MQKIPFHGNEGNFWKDDDYDLLCPNLQKMVRIPGRRPIKLGSAHFATKMLVLV